MINFLFEKFSNINYFFKKRPIKQIFYTLLASCLLFINNVNPAYSDQSLGNKLNDAINNVFEQNDSDDVNRPKTAREWDQQARETKGRPVEKLKRIGEQSAEAIKEFGSVYPDTAERSVSALEDNLKNSQKR